MVNDGDRINLAAVAVGSGLRGLDERIRASGSSLLMRPLCQPTMPSQCVSTSLTRSLIGGSCGSWTTPASRSSAPARSKHKGAVAACRDAPLFKVIYFDLSCQWRHPYAGGQEPSASLHSPTNIVEGDVGFRYGQRSGGRCRVTGLLRSQPCHPAHQRLRDHGGADRRLPVRHPVLLDRSGRGPSTSRRRPRAECRW